MHHNRFQQGDKVSYIGTKFASELHGKLGFVVGRVDNADGEVVVSFGSDAYIMGELEHLASFQGKVPGEGDQDDSSKAVKVEKRKGLGGKKNAKDQEAD